MQWNYQKAIMKNQDSMEYYNIFIIIEENQCHPKIPYPVKSTFQGNYVPNRCSKKKNLKD